MFDYEIADGVALQGIDVSSQLVSPSNVPTVTSTPTTSVPADTTVQHVLTDGNGYWEFSVPSNNIVTPSGSYYLVRSATRSMRVALPSGAGPFQASGNLAP